MRSFPLGFLKKDEALLQRRIKRKNSAVQLYLFDG